MSEPTSHPHPERRTARGARQRTRRAAAGAALAGLAATAAVLGAAPARSAPPVQDAQCPEPYPAADLVRGQQVTGLTVTQGTVPEQFTGEILGVLKDALGPGRDLVMARLSSDEIDRVGVWQGMSGSPVYAADGRLVGAVSEGLAVGASPVAGITPASDMVDLLSIPAGAQRSATRVRIGGGLRGRLVSGEGVTPRQAAAGLEPLRTPVSVAGVPAGRTFHRLTQRLRRHGFTAMAFHRGGGAPSAAPADASSEVFAGSNLAAALSYGDLSAVGVGTTTMVCGGRVVGFGHPFNFSGGTSMTLHGADALFIQDDLLTSFKVANPTGPLGSIDQDRGAGIVGSLGRLPHTTVIHTDVRLTDGRRRRADTFVPLPGFLPDATFFSQLAAAERLFDRIGPGSARTRLVIRGHTAAGRPFTVAHTNRQSDDFDIAGSSSFEAADAVDALLSNDFTDVVIDSVRTVMTLDPQPQAFRVTRVQRRVHGVWTTLRGKGSVKARAGQRLLLRTTLSSLKHRSGPLTVPSSVRVPGNVSPGSFGTLSVGGPFTDGESLGGGGSGAGNGHGFRGLVRALSHAPRNDALGTELTVFDEGSGRAHDVVRRSLVGEVILDGRSFDLLIR